MSKYFGEPSAWSNQKRQDYMEASGQINFHRVAIAEVKARIGKNCTFLSHLQSKGTIYFIAHLIIKGKKRVVRINTGKQLASELEAENYKALNTQLNDYVTGTKDI